MCEIVNGDLLRYQKIYKLDLVKYQINEELAEILAPLNKLKEYLNKIEEFKKWNITNIEREKISFDFYMFKKITNNLNKIKKIWLWISVNINYETLYFIYNYKKLLEKFKENLEKINKEIWKNVNLELLEIWNKDKSINSNKIESLNHYYDIVNWLAFYSIDDTIPYKELDKHNNHCLYEILPIILNNNLYKYIKIDIKWTKCFIENIKKMQKILDIIEEYKYKKNIIFEWLEDYKEIDKLIEWLKKYKNIDFYFQGFALHKPEFLK